MPFYIYDPSRTPFYSFEEKGDEDKSMINAKEVSFNWSESFFQIPASLEATDEMESVKNGIEVTHETEKTRETQDYLNVQETQENNQTFFVPETQYSTPCADAEGGSLMAVNITADQSILLPSINSILESSVRSALSHRQKQHHHQQQQQQQQQQQHQHQQHQLQQKFLIGTQTRDEKFLDSSNSKSSSPFIPAPVHQRVADKLAYELPSQNPNSPSLLYGNKSTVTDLTEDSLLLALNSSCIILDHDNNGCVKKDPKFSLDFLNTPPLMNCLQRNDDQDRISTQVLMQNLSSVDHQDMSLLSLDDNDNGKKKFDPLDLVPDTPTLKEDEEEVILDDDLDMEEGHHDAILFPDSFDESNNPFLTESVAVISPTQLATIKEEKENCKNDSLNGAHEKKDEIDQVNVNNAAHNHYTKLSTFEERLLATSNSTFNSSLTASPIQDFTLKSKKSKLTISSSKLAPISIKSSSSSSSSSAGSLLLSSRSISGDLVKSSSKTLNHRNIPAVLEPIIKKSLGTRILRNSTFNSTVDSSVISNPDTIASPATPRSTKITDKDWEEKYSNHLLKSGSAARITTILAEPRKTPIAGIKNDPNNSPFLTPSKAAKSIKISKEASLASYYADLVTLDNRNDVIMDEIATKTPNPQKTLDSTKSCSPDTLDAKTSFKESEWVFFKNGNYYQVGAVQLRTSKTRDIWRVKQSNGNEFSVSASEMSPVAFLRPGDEFFFKNNGSNKKSSDSQSRSSDPTNSYSSLLGPFKFNRFSPQNALMIEVIKESSKLISPMDCLKVTRICVEKDTFLKIKDRFDRGCIEDSHIRNQIITNISKTSKTSKKRTIHSITSDSQSTPASQSKRNPQIFSGSKFLITVGDNKDEAALKEKFLKLIESHGGEVLSNLSTDHEVPVLKTFLLSNGFKRTPKFITAIIRGVPRVHFNWIEACCNQNSFLDPDLGGFLIEPPAGSKPTGLLFKGKKFFIIGSSKFKNSWISVLRLLGGTVSSNNQSSEIIQFCEICTKANDIGVDWLIRCVVEKTFVCQHLTK